MHRPICFCDRAFVIDGLLLRVGLTFAWAFLNSEACQRRRGRRESAPRRRMIRHIHSM